MSDSEGERPGAAPAYDVQFHKRVCRCNVRSAVRISESNRNRHKPYFKCEEGECSFFEWWRPCTKAGRARARATGGRRECTRDLAESISREVLGVIRMEMEQLKGEIEEMITKKLNVFHNTIIQTMFLPFSNFLVDIPFLSLFFLSSVVVSYHLLQPSKLSCAVLSVTRSYSRHFDPHDGMWLHHISQRIVHNEVL